MDIIKIIEKINEVGLSNNDITRYGDGFEDAIFKVKEVITELYKETQALQLHTTLCNLYKWRKLNLNTTNKKELLTNNGNVA